MSVNIVVELKLNNTEKRSSLENILRFFFEAEIKEDTREDGEYLYTTTNDLEALVILQEWIHDSGIIDTIRNRLLKYQQGSLTTLYFNKQALAMDQISLVDLEDNPPLGPVLLQLIANSEEELNLLIDKLAPKTYEGRIVTAEEKEQILAKQQKNKN